MASLVFGHVDIRPDERRVLVNGQAATLGARAFDLLLALVEHRDRVVTKHELLDRVWPGLVVEEGNLPTQISGLRKALGPGAIATLPGRGYHFTLVPAGTEPPAPAAQAAPADSPPPAPPGNALPPAGLPASPTLLGRDDDLTELLADVRQHRFVTVLGAGGIGKTSLALGAAHALAADHADGAAWADLAPVSDAQLLPGAIGSAAGVPVVGREPVTALVAGLRSRRLLLVLDNAEHLLEPLRTLVPALLAGAPGLRLLVTSQAALHLQGEHLFRLGALAVPPPTASAEAAAAHGAVALFVDQARSADRGFTLDEANVGSVVELCRRLDGVALAIKLAAARLPLLGLAGLRTRLDERFRLLAGGPHDAPGRQQTLRAAMDWSYGLLPAAEQAVFRRLSVFTGSFPLDLAARSAADPDHDEWATIDLIGELVERSFVVVEPGDPPRYRLLESAREYGLLQLDARGEREAAHARVAHVLQQQFPALVERTPELLAWHLGEGGAHQAAVPLWASAAAQAAARGGLVEAVHHLGKAIGLLQGLALSNPGQAADFRRAELPLRLKRGSLHMLTRGMGSAEAQHDFERAHALAFEHGQLPEQFMATFNLWFVAEAQIRFDLTDRYIDQARRLAEASGDDRLMVQAHHARWTTACVLGRFDEVREHAEAGYRRYRPADALHHCERFAGHDPGICALAHLTAVHHMSGDIAAGREHAARTLAAMREVAHGPSRVIGAYGLAMAWVQLREPEALAPIALETLALCQRLSLTQYIGLFTTITAWVDAALRRDPSAGPRAVQGAEQFGATGSRLRQPLIRAIAAEAALLAGDPALAERTIALALQGIDEQGEDGWRPYALIVRADTRRALGDAAGCERDLQQAVSVARAQGALALAQRAANGLSAAAGPPPPTPP